MPNFIELSFSQVSHFCFRTNGLRHLQLEGRGLFHKTDKTQIHEKSQFGGANPAVRVYALLGSFLL
jgi:hypothetical protein